MTWATGANELLHGASGRERVLSGVDIVTDTTLPFDLVSDVISDLETQGKVTIRIDQGLRWVHLIRESLRWVSLAPGTPLPPIPYFELGRSSKPSTLLFDCRYVSSHSSRASTP